MDLCRLGQRAERGVMTIGNMSFCQKHWDMMREAVKTAGLWHLVPKDMDEVLERSKDENALPDPLMIMHNEALRVSLEQRGLRDGCPVCCDVEGCDCAFELFKDMAASLYKYLKEEGFVSERPS